MTVDSFKVNNVEADADDKAVLTNVETSNISLFIGADLSIPDTAVPGSYTGIMVVTVDEAPE